MDSVQKDPFRIARLILELRQVGITDTALLNMLEALPREDFLPESLAQYAYDDIPLPIPCGQSVTRPSTAFSMVDALRLGTKKRYNVLEIGTGSGYVTAILSKFAKRVYSIDRYRTLSEAARKRFEALGLFNIISKCADGALGWQETAPFDRIIATCANETVPEAWAEQLAVGGTLVAPIGTNEEQFVVRFTKQENGRLLGEPLMPSKFLHLAEGAAKEL